MDRNFLTSQNGREKALSERGSDIKDNNYIRELQTKEYKVFEASLVTSTDLKSFDRGSYFLRTSFPSFFFLSN